MATTTTTIPGAMKRKSHLHSDKERSIYDDHLFVSPASERTPSWSGTRWTRFFPELSSHFSLVSPVSTHSRSTTPRSGTSRVPSIGSEDTTESITGQSSLWSDELVDDASSCYSRKSSVTSLGSEASASAYKSADAFSIISPTRAGVFDDSDSVYRFSSSMSKREPSVADSKDKPLPCEPPIQMAPLSIRRKKEPPPALRRDTFDGILESIAQKQGDDNDHPPTMSQAAEELENALAGLVEHKHLSQDAPPCIDSALQVSRGNMDMIATRAAPIPPISPLKSRKLAKASSDEEMKRAKKLLKGRSPFSFTVPGFGRKQNRPHLRSLSSSNVLAGLERGQAHQEAVASRAAEKENASSGFLSPPLPAQRPASVSSERELRLKLPRLRTKEAQSSGITRQVKPLRIPSAADDVSLEIPHPEPKLRKTFSFESEGTMSKTTGSSSYKPIGPCYEMDVDSGPIVIYELDAGFPAQQIKTPVAVPAFVPSGEMPGTLSDEIVFLILRQCGSLQDLFNFAVVNNQFYRVFKRHELDLIKSTVFEMSPPAWELREMSPPWNCEWQVLFDLDAPVPEYTPSIYLDRYTRDLYTLVKLKSLILARCGTFLRPETVRGLAGMDDTRATEIDNAFWRVWAFCRIFGCGKGREGDVVGQLDWLQGGVMAKNQRASVTTSIIEPFGMNNVLFEPPEGFGRGNHDGLSRSQIYDMTEIWTCLGVLLQPIHGKRSEARRAGVFKGHDVTEDDSVKEEAKLEEWTSYVLTFGPSAVLALGSIATDENADEIFQRAQSMGLTKWEPADSSRSCFFREAVSKAYRPRDNIPRKSPPLRQTGSNSSRSSTSSSSTSSNDSPPNSIVGKPHRRRQAAYAAQLRNRRVQNQSQIAYAGERPISSYGEIMNRLAGAPAHPLYRLPLPTIPNAVPPLRTHTQPDLNTRNIQIPYSHAPHPTPAVTPLQRQPQIRDPADQAIDMMVRELGFNEDDAKWALKITDTGEGINPNAAVSLLIHEYQRQNPQRRDNGYSVPVQPQRNSMLSSVMSGQGGLGSGSGSGWRWA
ncbi:hypothetical protein BDW59DRAFT_178882 [Aspergillus cavernicola]|uniref:F-box domain protein n=1 Tax=Aspergillus cavernicola TaxID=176166 RepID=A0ABR4IKA8_9EURO